MLATDEPVECDSLGGARKASAIASNSDGLFSEGGGGGGDGGEGELGLLMSSQENLPAASVKG